MAWEPDFGLDNVGVDLDAAIDEEALERYWTVEGIGDDLGKAGFTRQARRILVQYGDSFATMRLDRSARTLARNST